MKCSWENQEIYSEYRRKAEAYFAVSAHPQPPLKGAALLRVSAKG